MLFLIPTLALSSSRSAISPSTFSSSVLPFTPRCSAIRA
jgi:hypothetical protein